MKRKLFFAAAAISVWSSFPAKSEVVPSSSIYVVDGDTIRLDGSSIRLIGFDTPETYEPQCHYELELGLLATNRLRKKLSSVHSVELIVHPGLDRYGRQLARLKIGQVDVADIMISEGLARSYDGGLRKGWCN